MIPSFSVSPFLDDYMIDITKFFVLINDLLCLESNAICMLFCRPFMLGLNRYALILLLSKSSTMWIYVRLVLFADFFIPISFERNSLKSPKLRSSFSKRSDLVA